MGSRTAAMQMTEATNMLGKQIRYSKYEVCNKLDELMLNPEKNKSEIDHFRGQKHFTKLNGITRIAPIAKLKF